MTNNRSGEKSAAAFRTISEVSDDLQVPQHVLRFWETKFAQVRPIKRGGGRRYYRPEDIELLRNIRDLLYSDGYTIKGVQKLLREGQVGSPGKTGAQQASSRSPGTGDATAGAGGSSEGHAGEVRGEGRGTATGTAPARRLCEADRQALRDVLDELVTLRASLVGDGG